MASRKLSGLQLDILSLYRQLLRAARAKGPDTSMAVRTEFRRNSSGVKRNNFRRIEYLIHQGKKKLTMLEQSTMTSIRR